jgi:RimJ/RimL family protein N-acetyltransferase
MNIHTRNHKLVLPLDLYQRALLAEAVSREGHEFQLVAGMNEGHIKRLQELSLDESDTALQENTGDKKRFGEGSYQNWYQNGRTIFALIHKETGDLAAVVWFGPKALGAKSLRYEAEKNKQEEAGDWHTIAYRCYPQFRGQGLMKGFVAFALDEYKKHFPEARFWAGMHSKNGASDALASSLGFVYREDLSDKDAEWVVMVKEQE